MVRKHYEGFFYAEDKSQIFYQTIRVAKPTFSLIVTHGHGEHSSSYSRLIKALENVPCDIYLWDLRGHGRSQGQRGYIANFKDYVRDFEQFIAHLQEEHKIQKTPVCLLGHSMGGLISMSYLTENAAPFIDKVALSSPLLSLKKIVPVYKTVAAKTLAQYLPKLTLGNEIADTELTRDLSVLNEFKRDPLRHNQMSSAAYLGFLEEIPKVISKLPNVSQKILVQLAEMDPIVNSLEVARVFGEIKNATVRVYQDRMHEIYNDIDREEVFKDLLLFLDTYSVS